jgi:hypothetical protein
MNDDTHQNPDVLTLIIDKPADGSEIDFRSNTISGRGLIHNETVYIQIIGPLVDLKFEVSAKQGVWSFTLPHFMPTGKNRVTARSVIFEVTNYFTATQPPPRIAPQEGTGVDLNGTGIFGTSIVVHGDSSDGKSVIGTAVVGSDGKWIPKWLEGFEPEEKEYVYVAKSSFSIGDKQFASDESQPETYSPGIRIPTITFPVIDLQERHFLLSGIDGVVGATLYIYIDLTSENLGEIAVTANDWSLPVTVKPGPVSLVALQVLNNEPSKRSAPRSFRIRPPELEEPEVTFLPDTSLKFSGSGHFDQNLSTEIQFSASNGSLPLPPNIPVNAQGQWEAAPVVWPLGSYDVTVIQKIADNANGWIESLPFDFKVHNDMPDITEASYTEEYLPVFSGKGYTGATVSLRFPDTTEAARSVVVVNGQWSTPALVKWGPTNKREVHITQHLGNYPSQRPCILHVTIPPLAPGLDDPSEEGLEPIFSGTCLNGATVSITFSDDDEVYGATVEREIWTFQRPTPFKANVEHIASATQTFVELVSEPISKTFTVHRVMLQPHIIAPVSGSEVGYEVTIEGDNGMQGAVMQLHDSQMGGTLGAPLELLDEGKWSIELRDLELRGYFLHAQQTLNGRESANSAEHKLNVVVPPPRFTAPIPGGKEPRTAKIAGTGRPTAQVEVWLQGSTEPLLTGINVNSDEKWEAEVSLPVGDHTIWAFQTFVVNGIAQRSQPNERLRYKVVPAAPFIETPTCDDHVGRRVVVSGFGTPGDTVTVTLGSDQASADVRDNRTWSVTLEPGQVEGVHQLDAVAACEGYESERANLSIRLATFLPTIEKPAPGSWVRNPVLFAGKGRQGVGILVDAFNPDKTRIASVQVDFEWQGLSEALPLGGTWCRFRQQPDDSDPTGSDWVVSDRFEIESAPADKTGVKIR